MTRRSQFAVCGCAPSVFYRTLDCSVRGTLTLSRPASLAPLLTAALFPVASHRRFPGLSYRGGNVPGFFESWDDCERCWDAWTLKHPTSFWRAEGSARAAGGSCKSSGGSTKVVKAAKQVLARASAASRPQQVHSGCVGGTGCRIVMADSECFSNDCCQHQPAARRGRRRGKADTRLGGWAGRSLAVHWHLSGAWHATV